MNPAGRSKNRVLHFSAPIFLPTPASAGNFTFAWKLDACQVELLAFKPLKIGATHLNEKVTINAASDRPQIAYSFHFRYSANPEKLVKPPKSR
jgi:hypothetical protein